MLLCWPHLAKHAQPEGTGNQKIREGFVYSECGQRTSDRLYDMVKAAGQIQVNVFGSYFMIDCIPTPSFVDSKPQSGRCFCIYRRLGLGYVKHLG